MKRDNFNSDQTRLDRSLTWSAQQAALKISAMLLNYHNFEDGFKFWL